MRAFFASRLGLAIIAIGSALLWSTTAMASESTDPGATPHFPVTLTDLAGHELTLRAPPRRIFLDNPRHLFALAALLPDPVARMSGWRGSLVSFDPVAQSRFEAAFPALSDLPTLGTANNAMPSAEALVTLGPDLIVADASRYRELQTSPLLAQLDALRIPILFIDFREHPLEESVPSLRLLGRALGAEPRADAMIQQLETEQAAVDDCLAAVTRRPRVLIDIAPGLKVDCCRSNFDSGLADLVAYARGDNIAAGMSPGTENVLNPETILSRDPDLIIATAAQWPKGGSIRAGFGVDESDTQRDMADVVARRPGWPALSAVNDGGFHALWHGYHQGPFSVVALQAIAGWLHPRQCAALAPEETLDSLYHRFMPIDASGTFQATYAGDPP
ncbi:MAG: ABC transporter substrate-binding protein [Salinicola sp.]|uniref:ABC transporter substrate-binding protein n=1 Tax=Salinicola sp. TaxID=1978524 RepID=UPI001D756089|nr:ABC transporter substrate-binding protein [Salinicola sp.]NRB54581.1 ABC transporter substrate-binding protein [Salinicola sp.]